MKETRSFFKTGRSEFLYNRDLTGTVNVKVYWDKELKNSSSMEVPIEDIIKFIQEYC